MTTMTKVAFVAVFAVFALGGQSTRAAIFDPADGWEEFAHFDGTVRIPASTYVNGLGSYGDANYSRSASTYDHLPGSFTIAVVMGDFVDYFRPVLLSSTLQTVLTSRTSHLWSADLAGPFVQPIYFASGSHLGGSAANWPDDGRRYLSFWGTNENVLGGCCTVAEGGSTGWGRAFTMYVQTPVPEPSTWLMLGSGLLAVAARAGRSRRRYVPNQPDAAERTGPR